MVLVIELVAVPARLQPGLGLERFVVKAMDYIAAFGIVVVDLEEK